MLRDIADDYNHPEEDIHYVKESIRGPGIEDYVFNEFFENVCACTEDSSDLCSISNECCCLRLYGQSYDNGLLRSEQLESKRSVFECSMYCCCGLSCSNTVAQRGPNKKLRICPVYNKGYGVLTLAELPKGAFVCEYAGEVLSHSEAQERLKHPDGCKYIMQVREHFDSTVIETFVDAFKIGNIGRYLNHSCDPNCVVIPVRAGRLLPKLCVFTNRIVNSEEELTYFYCPDSKVLSNKPCHCGSPRCLKFIPSV